MSGNFKNSSRKKKSTVAKHPFDARLLARAGEIARSYRLILEPDLEAGYLGRALEMPYAMGDGATPDACVKHTLEAITAAVATMLEMGQQPPQPSTEQRRTAQINIRLTEEEKMLLEEQSRQAGYRGVSEFVRAALLKRPA